MRSRREIRRIQAESESGELYTIIEYQQMARYTLMDRRVKNVATVFEYFLDDGRGVDQLSPRKYKIVQNDLILYAVEPI